MKFRKIIFPFFCIFSLFGCYDRGEIVQQPADLFIYKGKTYKAFKIAASGDEAIWVVLPSDSSSKDEPIPIRYKQGKVYVNVTTIP